MRICHPLGERPDRFDKMYVFTRAGQDFFGSALQRGPDFGDRLLVTLVIFIMHRNFRNEKRRCNRRNPNYNGRVRVNCLRLLRACVNE